MRVKLDVESGFLALFVAGSALAVAQATGFVYPAGLLPLVVGIPTLLISLAALAVHWARPSPGAAGGAEPPRTGQELRTVGWVVCAVVLMWLLGIVVTIPLYVFLYATIVGRIAWPRSAVLGLGVGLVVYVLFVVALGLQLHPGWIWQWT